MNHPSAGVALVLVSSCPWSRQGSGGRPPASSPPRRNFEFEPPRPWPTTHQRAACPFCPPPFLGCLVLTRACSTLVSILQEKRVVAQRPGISSTMGLDVKEKALLTFIAKVTFPLVVVMGPFIAYTRIWEHPFWFLGLVTFAVLTTKALYYLLERLTRRRKDLPREYGKWAIVTGATSGIGEAFAHELAQRGMSVLIISRTPAKLEKTKADILRNAPEGVEVEVLAFDFTCMPKADAFYLRLREVAASLHKRGGIGMLINNVGTNVEVPEFLHALPESEVLDIVRVNVEGTVRMTRTVLPFMADRRAGAIINVSSGSGNHPTPLLSTYAATKAFINEFSRSLHYEAKHVGIDVLVATPYYVSTPGMYNKPPGLLNCSSHRFVQDTLNVLGRYDSVYPYIAHAILGTLMDKYWATPAALFKSMNKTRMRALAKRQQQKEDSSSTQKAAYRPAA